MINIYFTSFTTPFCKATVASIDSKVCWLSFNDDGTKFKQFMQSYSDKILSDPMSINFKKLNNQYPLIVQMFLSEKLQLKEDSKKFSRILNLIDAYFQGNKVNFKNVELIYLIGTEFQQTVWDKLRDIDYGTVKSYKDVSGMIGHPGASRAVGSANKQNIIPLIVPCHRIIKNDGSLGGYSAGIEIKKKLLALENITYRGYKDYSNV